MIRDTHTNAVLANDIAALDKYRLEKGRIRQLDNLRKDVANLQETVHRLCAVVERITKDN